jgi:hypothetical protein
MSGDVVLSNVERRVLRALSRFDGWEGGFTYFRTLSRSTKLRRNEVRLACRSLARKGLAKYGRGLFDDYTGEVAGSGYCITRAGSALLTSKPIPAPIERTNPSVRRGTTRRVSPPVPSGIFFNAQPLDHSSHENTDALGAKVAGLHGRGGTL